MKFIQQKMKLKIPLYRNQKLRLAFEFGLTIASVAREQEVTLTPEIIERAEKVLVEEFSSRSASKIAGSMVAVILAILEPEEV